MAPNRIIPFNMSCASASTSSAVPPKTPDWGASVSTAATTPPTTPNQGVAKRHNKSPGPANFQQAVFQDAPSAYQTAKDLADAKGQVAAQGPSGSGSPKRNADGEMKSLRSSTPVTTSMLTAPAARVAFNSPPPRKALCSTPSQVSCDSSHPVASTSDATVCSASAPPMAVAPAAVFALGPSKQTSAPVGGRYSVLNEPLPPGTKVRTLFQNISGRTLAASTTPVALAVALASTSASSPSKQAPTPATPAPAPSQYSALNQPLPAGTNVPTVFRNLSGGTPVASTTPVRTPLPTAASAVGPSNQTPAPITPAPATGRYSVVNQLPPAGATVSTFHQNLSSGAPAAPTTPVTPAAPSAAGLLMPVPAGYSLLNQPLTAGTNVPTVFQNLSSGTAEKEELSPNDPRADMQVDGTGDLVEDGGGAWTWQLSACGLWEYPVTWGRKLRGAFRRPAYKDTDTEGETGEEEEILQNETEDAAKGPIVSTTCLSLMMS